MKLDSFGVRGEDVRRDKSIFSLYEVGSVFIVAEFEEKGFRGRLGIEIGILAEES